MPVILPLKVTVVELMLAGLMSSEKPMPIAFMFLATAVAEADGKAPITVGFVLSLPLPVRKVAWKLLILAPRALLVLGLTFNT